MTKTTKKTLNMKSPHPPNRSDVETKNIAEKASADGASLHKMGRKCLYVLGRGLGWGVVVFFGKYND